MYEWYEKNRERDYGKLWSKRQWKIHSFWNDTREGNETKKNMIEERREEKNVYNSNGYTCVCVPSDRVQRWKYRTNSMFIRLA